MEKGIDSKDGVDICNCLELDAEVSLSEDVVKFVHLLYNKFDWIPPFIDQKCILESSMVYDLETEPYLEVLRLQVCDERKVTIRGWVIKGWLWHICSHGFVFHPIFLIF